MLAAGFLFVGPARKAGGAFKDSMLRGISLKQFQEKSAAVFRSELRENNFRAVQRFYPETKPV
ncbi:hypothetical protein [Mesorhizobium sp.]|uniref:hypothetical protein n=1 Tax=Mesorhizobium sp. TaxID=1871066 RepID=UPI00257ED62E|nr:hypothetical protein [Mesorhizobium sp.]